MYEHFTDRARKVMQLANQKAHRFNHEYIGTEHLLLGLIKGDCGVGLAVLMNLGVSLRTTQLKVEDSMPRGPGSGMTTGKLPQTPGMKRVIEYSIEEAENFNRNNAITGWVAHHVGTEHILLGLLRAVHDIAAQVLMNQGLTLEKVRAEVVRLSETITQPFSIPYNATDPLDILNAVMRFEDPPPQDKRWEIRIAALCEVVAARNKETARLREEVVRLAGEKESPLTGEYVERWECCVCGIPCHIAIHATTSSPQSIERFRSRVCLCIKDTPAWVRVPAEARLTGGKDMDPTIEKEIVQGLESFADILEAEAMLEQRDNKIAELQDIIQFVCDKAKNTDNLPEGAYAYVWASDWKEFKKRAEAALKEKPVAKPPRKHKRLRRLVRLLNPALSEVRVIMWTARECEGYIRVGIEILLKHERQLAQEFESLLARWKNLSQ